MSKKSEHLEIRLSHADKQAFMAQCRAEGRSASETLRGFIESRLEPPAPRPRRLRYLAIGAFAGAALGAAAAPSLAHTVAAPRCDAATFMRLDADHDGRVSPAEFTRAGEGSGRP